MENLQNIPSVILFNLRLNAECQDLAGMKKMTWVHDEHVITICGTEKDITPKLMLKATKFSVF